MLGMEMWVRLGGQLWEWGGMWEGGWRNLAKKFQLMLTEYLMYFFKRGISFPSLSKVFKNILHEPRVRRCFVKKK